MKQHIQTRRTKKGQGLVEFALVAPILLMMVFGIVDFGWMVFNFSQLTNAMREAVRYGSVNGFGGGSQIKQCANIRSRILTNAGLSGVQSSNIWIWYDDGRPVSGTVPTNAPTYTNSDASVVGGCNGNTVQLNSGSYLNETGTSPARSKTGIDVQNGDRIVVHVEVNVHFLTPFFQGMVPSGIAMTFTNSRSIFPDGLAG